MVKTARKKLVSKSKFKRKSLNQHKKEVEKETVETPPTSAETKTTSLGGLTNTPLQSNNITMEEKEESVPEIDLPKEENIEQKESVPELTPDTKVLAEEKNDRLSFLTEKPKNEEKINNEEKPKKPFLTIIIVLAAFLLGMLAGGFIILKKGNIFAGKIPGKKEIAAESQEQAPPSPAPTEEPVDLTKYTIEVLNGSGTKGAAGGLKDSLSKEGFDVSSIGNATSSSFTESVIRAKKEVDQRYLTKLKNFLLKSYSLSEIQELPDSKKTDVVIIIGYVRYYTFIF